MLPWHDDDDMRRSKIAAEEPSHLRHIALLPRETDIDSRVIYTNIRLSIRSRDGVAFDAVDPDASVSSKFHFKATIKLPKLYTNLSVYVIAEPHRISCDSPQLSLFELLYSFLVRFICHLLHPPDRFHLQRPVIAFDPNECRGTDHPQFVQPIESPLHRRIRAEFVIVKPGSSRLMSSSALSACASICPIRISFAGPVKSNR